jgi:threonine dehydrogenase-like Zn-dependent dehydrogenase
MPFFKYPVIPGHELGVEVLAVGGGVTEVAQGDRCAVEPYMNCGTCAMCISGKSNACPDLQVIGIHTDGGMREEILVPAKKLHPKNSLEYDQLALVETLAIGCHGVNRSNLSAGETALVVGAGPIGLTVVTFARLRGARVAVVDISKDRLSFCRETFGVDTLLPSGSGGLPRELEELFGGNLPQVVFDATGNGTSMGTAIHLAGSGARVVYVGVYNGDISINDPELHRKELTLLATRNAPSDDFPFIIERMEKGDIDTRRWVTHRASCVDMIEQFPGWLRPEAKTIKAIVSFT